MKIGVALRSCVVVSALFAVMQGEVFARSEFQVFSQANSGRGVDCAMCHAHPNGPEGLKPGQIGSLNAQELKLLGLARTAFEPGSSVENPILNDFGNRIVFELGKRTFLELRAQPELLGSLLSADSDLDHDGIPDATEFLQGTHPLSSQHGAPGALFLHNLGEQWFPIVMLAVATALGLYGLRHLLIWFSILTDQWSAESSSSEGD